MNCYFCGIEATAQCPRCHRPYCHLHGDGLCQQCGLPISLLPSTTVYRGALVLLVLSLAFGAWQVFALPEFPVPEYRGNVGQLAPLSPDQPPGGPAAGGRPPATTETVTPTPTPSSQPDVTAPQPPPPPAPAAARRTYIVQSGDTLLGIALRFDVTVTALAAANSIESPYALSIGQELIIP